MSKISAPLLRSLPGLGVIESLVLQLQLVCQQALGRFERLALIGAFARQDVQRFQPPRDQFVTQQHLDVGGRGRPATGRKDLVQALRAIKARAIQQIQGAKVAAQGLGLEGAPQTSPKSPP